MSETKALVVWCVAAIEPATEQFDWKGLRKADNINSFPRMSEMSSTPATRAVFLSYASQDAEAAKRICEALRAAGIEVWFDQSELVGGDQWDAKIRGQVKSCALFVPIISVATQARPEGYFRLEWHLAEQRSLLIAKGRPFIVPVSVDATSDRDALVPDAFLAVQWMRLPADGKATAFAERVKSLLAEEAVRRRSPETVMVIPVSVEPSTRATRTSRLHPRWGKAAIAATLVLLVVAGSWRVYRTHFASRIAVEQADAHLGPIRYLPPVPVVVGPESDEWPTPSPDGKTLAFVRLVGGYKQIFIKSLETDGSAQQLTDDETDHIQPRWSPDRQEVLYSRPTAGQPPSIRPSDVWGGFYSPNHLDVWVKNVASGKTKLLLEQACDARFSRQGAIAYTRFVEGSNRIWICDRNGNERKLVTEDPDKVEHFEPDWSPDGRRIVFRRMQGKTSMLSVVELDTRKTTHLTENYYLSEPTWSPSGKYIYFSANLASGFNLWRMPVTAAAARGGPFEPVTFGIGRDLHPAFSADGNRLFYSIVSWNSDIWALPMDPEKGRPAGEPFPLIESAREDTRGDWSADGRRIAFTSDRGGQMNLYVAGFDPETRVVANTVQVTFGPGGDYQASWNPKRNQIAFFSRRSGNEDIWLVDLRPNGTAASPPRQLTTNNASDINPVFSPDGSHIAFMSDRTGITLPYVMNADGSGQRILAELPTGGHYMRWMDTNTVVFGSRGIYTLGYLDGKDPQPLTKDRSGINTAHLSLSPDHRFFADNNHVSLQLWDRKTGQAETNLFTFPDKNVGVDYTVWSPDGRFILFDRNNPQGGDIYELKNPE